MPAWLARELLRNASSAAFARRHAIDPLEPRLMLAGDVVSSLRITEINYNPDGNNAEAEFIELKNIGPQTVNLAGVKFTVGIPCTFDPIDLLPGESCIAVRDRYDFISRAYPYYGSGFDGNLKIAAQYGDEALSNGGERLVLCDAAGTVIQDFTYDDNSPWPTAADGNGYSLVFSDPTRPAADWNNPYAWRSSQFMYGTPGADETAVPLGSIVVNEVLAHTHVSPVGTWVEFYNPTDSDIDISGWRLSSTYRDGIFRYAIPSGTVIHARDYVVFDQANDFGSSGPELSEEYGNVVLSSANAFGIFSGFAVSQYLPASPPEVTIGRISLTYGGSDFGFLAAASKGERNGTALVGPVVISEMLCDPIATSEYIELHNISDAPVPLFDPNAHYRTWTLGGVDYDFPENTTLEPDEYVLVVPVAPGAYRTAHPEVPASVRIFGPYYGFIENNGETITLERPANTALDPNGYYYTVDSVYTGYLLHDTAVPAARLNISGYSNDPANWAQEVTSLGSPGRPNFSLLTGDGTPHTWTLNTMNGYFQVFENRSGALIFHAPLASLPAFTVLGNSSDDQIFIKTAFGIPIPPGGLTFDPGIQSSADALHLAGDMATISFTPGLTVDSGTFTFPAGQTLAFRDTESVDLNRFPSLTVNLANSTPNALTVAPAPGSLQITGSAGSTAIHPLSVAGLFSLTVLAPTGFNTLNIAGGSFNLNTVGAFALALSNDASVKLATQQRFSALSLADSARLDLLNRDLILDYSGSSPLNAIRQWICNGRQGSASAAILTSLDQFSPGHYAALAPVDNAAIRQTTWNGQPLTTAPNFSQVIIKYTCRGDTNLDGQVDADDYANIIANMGRCGTNWLCGDANNDGIVSPDDYAEVTANLCGPTGAQLLVPASPIAAAPVASSARKASSKAPAAQPKLKHPAPLRRAKPRRHR